MKSKKFEFLLPILFSGLLVFVHSCKDETYVYQQDSDKGTPFNPNLPVEITGFMPDSGKIAEKVVINGSNFGNIASEVRVFFNDGYSDKEASVISVNGSSIYCLAPRLSGGDNQIKVIVSESTETVAPKTFHYTASAYVSWVAGIGLRDGTGAFYQDGTLAESHFHKIMGIVALGDDQIMTFGSYESMANKVRFISVNDNRVITLQDGVYLGKPAINEDKTAVYATTLNPTHTVYEYRKDNGWMPYRIGEIPERGSGYDHIQSMVMMDKEHDPAQEWLYFCHKSGYFGRFNINTQQTEDLGENLFDQADYVGYLVYDKFNNCFYLSHHTKYCIYKISKTGATWTDGVRSDIYAGSPNQSAVVDGSLADARFRDPRGMCMDDDGNLYICEFNNSNVIRKISALDGYVSTVAGTLNVESPQTNGDPAEAIFLDPRDISYDGNGNFFIAEWWEATIRRYAVQ
ncbi:IPT/TIG domain-containing protein [Proteiniphilum sp.]|uniref:IPT/TIG domain-containing protein n=1 Tax=Proteiniphilum sp. TaxID=1926877 RepID=UPI00331AC74A